MNNKTTCSMRLAYVLMTLTLLTARPALAQHQLWIRQFGTSRLDEARALAPDGAGGILVAGVTAGSLGGPIAGRADAFLARYDGAGTRLWIRQFGTSSIEGASGLAPDGAGGVIIAGWTGGSLGGPNAGFNDVFVARYNSAGDQLWVRQFGAGFTDQARALAPDGAGGAIVAGETSRSLGGPALGGWDAFMARYDDAGNQLWIRQFGTSSSDRAFALASDGAAGVFVAGETQGSLGGLFAGGFSDAFLARYDDEGKQLWIRQFGTSGDDWASALASDGAGGVMVAGETGGNLAAPVAGTDDAFLARYDSEGNQLWIRQFGTNDYDRADALAPDGAGGVIVAGTTGGNLGGSSAGGWDVFLARYDSVGNQLWTGQLGTGTREDALAIAPDGAGGLMITAWTWGSLGGPNAGSEDVVLARYEIESCYPDCDRSTGNGVLDIFDFLCFQNSFVAGAPYACDCDTSTGPGVCDMSDFLCFQTAFFAGCP